MEEKAKAKKKTVLIIAIIIVLLVVIGAMASVIYILVNDSKAETTDRSASEGLVIDGKVDKKASEATFTTDMNMIWTFPSGSAVSNNAHVGNSELNKYDVYFEVYLDDEEQTLLYTSPTIPVGKQIGELKLDKVLEDGEYPAICTYHLIDDEDPTEEVSKVSFNVTLIFAE